ncbi:hypothetical protein E2562_014752 [Oryza meyeriana var. granulata]|uniref:Uncharacterized protein n=1 Tax=Oryza meyeriana var. granulata TaxID=110450 RepID=A0A6G1BKZ4_9ORYZ|nr:hypothetical protein E2562_014752 [Oryza meyeriana var. granulata]
MQFDTRGREQGHVEKQESSGGGGRPDRWAQAPLVGERRVQPSRASDQATGQEEKGRQADGLRAREERGERPASWAATG